MNFLDQGCQNLEHHGQTRAGKQTLRYRDHIGNTQPKKNRTHYHAGFTGDNKCKRRQHRGDYLLTSTRHRVKMYRVTSYNSVHIANRSVHSVERGLQVGAGTAVEWS